MPAKRIIILERDPSSQQTRFRFLLWADVPVARRTFHAEPGRVSAWKGASAAENTAIGDGSVEEQSGTVTVNPPKTVADVQAELELLWTQFQTAITNENTFTRYGTHWTGAGAWVAGGA